MNQKCFFSFLEASPEEAQKDIFLNGMSYSYSTFELLGFSIPLLLRYGIVYS